MKTKRHFVTTFSRNPSIAKGFPYFFSCTSFTREMRLRSLAIAQLPQQLEGRMHKQSEGSVLLPLFLAVVKTNTLQYVAAAKRTSLHSTAAHLTAAHVTTGQKDDLSLDRETIESLHDLYLHCSRMHVAIKQIPRPPCRPHTQSCQGPPQGWELRVWRGSRGWRGSWWPERLWHRAAAAGLEEAKPWTQMLPHHSYKLLLLLEKVKQMALHHPQHSVKGKDCRIYLLFVILFFKSSFANIASVSLVKENDFVRKMDQLFPEYLESNVATLLCWCHLPDVNWRLTGNTDGCVWEVSHVPSWWFWWAQLRRAFWTPISLMPSWKTKMIFFTVSLWSQPLIVTYDHK